jgi:hypothetical protein
LDAPSTKPDIGNDRLKMFATAKSFFDFMDEIIPEDKRIAGGEGTYKELLEQKRSGYISFINNPDGNLIHPFTGEVIMSHKEWLGLPYPVSLDDALSRISYQNMEEYKRVYEELVYPRLQELLKNSIGEFDLPKLMYNDRGLGNFDFNKASTGLVPILKYYSFAKKDFVEKEEVHFHKIGKDFKLSLIEDGTPVVAVPKLLPSYDKELVDSVYKEVYEGADVFKVLKRLKLRIGGNQSISSTVKKSYILKEKVTRPKKAIRIFLKLGCSYVIKAEQYKWTGYLATAIAELLSILDYSVNIWGVFGISDEINADQDGRLVGGTRYWGVQLKSFHDTLDKPSLLYMCSDVSFFRIKCFDYLVKYSQKMEDHKDGGLGYPSPIRDIEEMVFSEYGKRDAMFLKDGTSNTANSQFLYYIIGDILSEQDLNKKILEIALDIVNENKLAKDKLTQKQLEQRQREIEAMLNSRQNKNP